MPPASGMMVFDNENQPLTRSTHLILPRNDPDRIQIAFDDHRLVANAGLSDPAGHANPPPWISPNPPMDTD